MTTYKYRGHHHAYGIRNIPKYQPRQYWPHSVDHATRRLERVIRRAKRRLARKSK